MSSDTLARVTGVSLTAVVCAYTASRWPGTMAAISSLQVQAVPPTQILLVIDCNRDLYLTARNRFGGAGIVTVLENTRSPGLSGSRNTAVAAATGDVIAFLDDDARVSGADWAGSLLGHFSARAQVQVIGGSAVPEWTGGVADWLPTEFYWVIGCSFAGQPTSLASTRNVLGCNMAVRRSALAVVGEFDTTIGRGRGRLPMGNEETDLCIRVNNAFGSDRVLYDPNLVVRHDVTTERATFGYFVRRCYAEGLSKAQLTSLAGARAALSTERRYTVRTLPLGFAREVGRALRGGEGRRSLAVARAATIVAGFAITACGYLRGRALPGGVIRRRR